MKNRIIANSYWFTMLFLYANTEKSTLKNLEGELKKVLYDVASNSDFEILEMEYDLDHVHLLVKSVRKLVYYPSLEN